MVPGSHLFREIAGFAKIHPWVFDLVISLGAGATLTGGQVLHEIVGREVGIETIALVKFQGLLVNVGRVKVGFVRLLQNPILQLPLFLMGAAQTLSTGVSYDTGACIFQKSIVSLGNVPSIDQGGPSSWPYFMSLCFFSSWPWESSSGRARGAKNPSPRRPRCR